MSTTIQNNSNPSEPKKSINMKLGMFLVAIAASIWAWTGTAGQILSQNKHLDVYWIVCVRMICSGVILFALSLFRNKKMHFAIWKERKDRLRLLLFTILGTACMQVSYFACIAESNAATATILQYLAPAIVIVALIAKYRKRPSATEIVCTMLALAGVFCIGTHGSFHTLALSPQALAWGLLSAVSMAFYTAYPLKLMRTYGTETILSWGFLLTGIGMCAIFRPWSMQQQVDRGSIVLMAVLILLGTVIAFCVFSAGASVIGGARASILGTIEPIVSAVIGFFLFHQRFTAYDYVGIACILAITIMLALDEMGVFGTKEVMLDN